MLQGWVIVTVSFAYLGVLFAIAYYGDKRADAGRSIIAKPTIYALSLAVYCTTWTFYGSVGRAASTGIGFLPIYLGPTLMAALWWFVMLKIIRISKANRITSIADFIASRYGKSQMLGGLVTVIAVVGVIPYISLQLKAVSNSFTILLHYPDVAIPARAHAQPFFQDSALYIAMILAVFTILFGTRHLDATERHEGMVAAVAFESLVKLLAFLAVGTFVTFGIYNGFGDVFERAEAVPRLKTLMTMADSGTNYVNWWSLTFLSMLSIMLLPRQFQITVVENVSEQHLARATWLFPFYLLLINIFVLPITLGGLLHFPDGSVDADTFVLTLPMAEHREGLALFVFIGGLSAATAMVIVETIALSTMVCNDLVMPVLLRQRWLRLHERQDLSGVLLSIRRWAIGGILLLGYLYFRAAGEAYALVGIGLISFAAVAQFAPAIFGAIYWKGGTKDGAIAGLLAGFAVWGYTLLLPSFAKSGWLSLHFIQDGLFGAALLKPHELFGVSGLDEISHSLFWSMLANIGAYVGVSLAGSPGVVEAGQATLFVDVFRHGSEGSRARRGSVQVGDLLPLIGRFLGPERAREAFLDFAQQRGLASIDELQASAELVNYAETVLAGAIGSASARVMVASVTKEEQLGVDEVMNILDEASQVRAYSLQLEQKSRELEEATAEALRERASLLDLTHDTVFVRDMNNIITFWNRGAETLYGWTKEEAIGQVAHQLLQTVFPAPLEEMMAELNSTGRWEGELIYTRRDGRQVVVASRWAQQLDELGKPIAVLETNNDITERKRAEEERQAHLGFLESMDQVNRALQRTNDLEQMMSDVLDAVLAIFKCDRAWLVYPCDPQAASWKVPMEHARPEFPGVFALGLDLPVDSEIATVFQTVRAVNAPVRFGPRSEHPLPEEAAQRFSIKSMIAMAVYPKGDKPYMLGLHQCSYPRVWTPQEERLFQEIGRRLEDTLTSLLIFRNLGESERKLEEAHRLAHVGYWERDTDTDLITWSDETYRIFGLEPQKRTFHLSELADQIHPEDKPLMIDAVTEALRGGRRYDVEYRVIRPNGEVRLVHSQGDITRDESGRPRRMFGSVQDITERKLAEQRLMAQHRVTALLAEAATLEEVTPKILKTVCELLFWDVGALWRIDREAAVLRCVEVWHKPSVEIAQFEAVTRERTLRTGVGLPGRVWSSHEPAYIPDVTKDPNFPRGSIAARAGLHAGFAFPILLGADVLGVMEFFSHEIRQPEQELLDMMATLGSQVGQFIERKRAEQGVLSAQAELAHVTRVATLGELTASIAHEINQPLGAIVNNASACLSWLTANNLEEARTSAEMIRADGHRAGEIIGRIRALAKKAPPQKDWLDINETIREVIALAHSELQRNSIALETRLSDDVHYVPLAFADRIQLQQVILNLMMNGVEAMSEIADGSRELLIRTDTNESGGIVVAVRDSGPGLKPEDLHRLFTPFYTTKPQGMGMGLAICRSIIEAHGGRLWATANLDRGATFQFTLPTGRERTATVE